MKDTYGEEQQIDDLLRGAKRSLYNVSGHFFSKTDESCQGAIEAVEYLRLLLPTMVKIHQENKALRSGRRTV
jgi:hypothetical protein